MEWWWLSLLVAITVAALVAYRRATRQVTALTNNLEAALGALAPEAPRFYYLRAEGPPQGPVDLTTLRAMVIDGRLGADALTAPAGTDDWLPAARLFDDDAAPRLSGRR